MTRPKIWTIPIPRLFSVPNFFETDSDSFFGTKIFRDRFRDFFSVLIFFETGSETFFGTNFFSRPVPIPSKNCKNPGNGTRPGPKSTLIFWKILRLVSIFFFGTKIFRDRFRDFFRYQNFSRPVPRLFSVPNFFETGSETFFGTKFFRFRFRYHQKKWRIPGNGNSRDRDVTLCHTEERGLKNGDCPEQSRERPNSAVAPGKISKICLSQKFVITKYLSQKCINACSTIRHTWYLSFFLHLPNFLLNFSPHKSA